MSQPETAADFRRGILLPCALLLGAMFNLTLVVAGLKELVLDELGGTIRDASLFFSIETTAYILFAPLWGLVSDRLGRRKVLVVTGFALSALIYGCYQLVDSVPLLLALRFVQGACSVMGWSLVMALVLDHPGAARSGRYMGVMGAALIFGVGLGAPAGGYLTSALGARAPLAAAAVLFALLAGLALLLREPASLRQGLAVGRIFAALRASPRLLLPMLCHFVDRLAVGLFVVIFPLHLDSLGAGAAVRGRYLSYFLLPFALLQLATGRLAERTGPYPPLILGSLAYGLVLAAVGVADLHLLGPVMVALGVFAAVMFPPAMLLTARLAAPSTRGSAIGGFNLAGSLGFAVGPLLGAWAYAAYGFGFAFALCGAFEVALALGAAGWWLWRRPA
ncbi:MAG: MFS transporter [Acidobacteriota bacterium]|nr:MFS transporter [Acidobacteriota bacterium]MDH3524805.1 MFS transporter [Acidobacteriota bacterium]